jgi:hypothetical protein
VLCAELRQCCGVVVVGIERQRARPRARKQLPTCDLLFTDFQIVTAERCGLGNDIIEQSLLVAVAAFECKLLPGVESKMLSKSCTGVPEL